MRLRLAVKQTRPLALAQQWLANRRRHLRRQASTPPGGTSIYMMHGSFMVLLRRYFEATAGLHFPGFLFGEELFVAEETRKAQGRIVFAPTLQLNHWGGATTNELGSARRDRLEADSLRLMIRAYF